jgi:hypothetical protein
MKAKLTGVAIGAALLMSAGNVFAADLGGNCCADLEERIAELEATAARKGNRKVSLMVTGWVSSQIWWFDDGIESNTYVVDNNNDLSSHVRFTGSAQISPGWKAGYALALYTQGPSSLNGFEDWSATKKNTIGFGGDWSVAVENSYWFIESDKLGKVTVGKQSMAMDNLTVFADLSPIGNIFASNTVATFDGFANRVVVGGLDTGTRWGAAAFYCGTIGAGIANDCNGTRLNGIRYDTPTFAGFSASAGWGEDDYWDVAARYSGEGGGFKYTFAAGYAEITDNAIVGLPVNDNQRWQVGGSIKHNPSGLWVHATYDETHVDDVGPVPPHPDLKGFFLKAGWTGKLNSLGNTSFWGEYGRNWDTFSNLSTGSSFFDGTIFGSQIISNDATRLGGGIIQEIDAASMSFWAKYTVRDLDFDLANGTSGSADTLKMFLAGAVIFY